MNFLLLIAVLPAAALMYYVYKKDTVEKEPIKLVGRMLVLGMVAGPIAGILEGVLFDVFDWNFAGRVSDTMLLVLDYFIGVALVEEGLKFLFLNTMRKNLEFNYVFDGVVYAVAVSLGFAALENILYVSEGGVGVAIVRAIFSVPGHCAGGVVMGCFFGLAKQREIAGNKGTASLLYVLALVLPVLEHGFYDAALSSDSDVLAFLALGVELAFIGLAAALVNKMSKSDQAIYPENYAQQQMLPDLGQVRTWEQVQQEAQQNYQNRLAQSGRPAQPWEQDQQAQSWQQRQQTQSRQQSQQTQPWQQDQ